MPLIIQPSNSAKKSNFNPDDFAALYPSSTLLVDSLEHIFSATLSIELGEHSCRDRKRREREICDETRNCGEYLEGEWKSLLNVRDDLDYDNINCSTHNHNHI